jgi:hypothetical protein
MRQAPPSGTKLAHAARERNSRRAMHCAMQQFRGRRRSLWEDDVETVYDWVTVAIFAGLVVLFLQRSSGADEPEDSIWQYLAASVGCALSNYLGNKAIANGEGGAVDYLNHALALAVLAAVLAYVWFALKPLKRR